MRSEEIQHAQTVWGHLSKRLESSIPLQFYQTFFQRLQPVSWRQGILVLGSEDERIVAHIKHRYMDTVQKMVQEIAPDTTSVSIQKLEQTAHADTEMNNTVAVENPPAKIMEKPPEQAVASHQYPNQININAKYTFDRFVRGPSNEHAVAAAEGVANQPTDFHNPLYLYGGVGLGKTHLMMAIGNAIRAKYPWMTVMYTPSETFQSDLINAVARKTLDVFKAKYRNVDVLLIDDIQFISARAEYTQEEIFHTFNYLYQNKKHVVVSGDRPPQNLATLTDRLISRFQSGLIVDIKPPNLETRMAILRSKATEIGMQVPHEVLRLIASRITTEVRLMEATLNKLQFISGLEEHPIDLQMAKLALRDLPGEDSGPSVTIDEILRVVSQTYRVAEEEIKGSSRTENIVMARHVCMFLARKLLPRMTQGSIAAAFGRNDHTTVINAERKIKDMIDKDEAFGVEIQELTESLQF